MNALCLSIQVNDGEEDNGANEATSAKSGTEHYEDAEDAEANGDEDMDEISTPQVGCFTLFRSIFASLG